MRRRFSFVLGATLALTACRLFVSLEGLGDGPPLDEGGPADDVVVTASPETGPTTSDAGGDHTVTPFDAAGFPGLDASFDGADAKTFFDDFERPNADPLGNGWVERFSGAFNIVGGAAAKQTSINNYRDNIVYRPAAENGLDMEVQAEIRFTGAAVVNLPMLWARAQNIGANRVDGYHIYLDCCYYHFHLGRHLGSVSTEIAAFDTPLVVGQSYRLTLRVLSTDAVAVYARVDARGDGGAWEMRGQTGYIDLTPERIQTPGAAGFSGDVDPGYTFDNFSRVGY
jgi:hypothetical protein